MGFISRFFIAGEMGSSRPRVVEGSVTPRISRFVSSPNNKLQHTSSLRLACRRPRANLSLVDTFSRSIFVLSIQPNESSCVVNITYSSIRKKMQNIFLDLTENGRSKKYFSRWKRCQLTRDLLSTLKPKPSHHWRAGFIKGACRLTRFSVIVSAFWGYKPMHSHSGHPTWGSIPRIILKESRVSGGEARSGGGTEWRDHLSG